MPHPTDQQRVKTVLVVDDNEANRYILSRALRQAGYAVLEAADGGEALALSRDKPDLITLDVHLPDINGMEVCRRIKQEPELRQIPVIHISATFVQSHDKVAALNSGADGYLTHPVEDVVLIATVSAFIRARQAEKEREQLLARSQLDLEELRIERDLRERFVATLTHDLRTPMTAAAISAQLIQRQPDVSPVILRLVGRVRDNLDRADRMIRDLLDVNRIRAGEKLPLELRESDLAGIVEATLADLASTHGDRFVLRAPGPLPGAWDGSAVRRVVENLAGNALKYGAEYGAVTVSLDDRGEAVALSVHNVGNPIPEEGRANLFKPYNRAVSPQASGQKGWGLGLTLVRGVADAHGGEVEVESSPENGTTFTVVLPRGAGYAPGLRRVEGGAGARGETA